MEEIWKDIQGYEGLYQVSNLGRVRSVDRLENNGRGCNRARKGRILTLLNKRGYTSVGLSKNGITKQHQVHRLVAVAFKPNPDNLPQVNHKDENKANNCVDNLEWCTSSYNINYGDRNYKVSISSGKSIIQISMDNTIITEWKSSGEASKTLGISQGHINACCNHRYGRKTAGGFKWEFK